MYCVNCGVELGPNEEHCPLCGTPVYRPNGTNPTSSEKTGLYPPYEAPDHSSKRRWIMVGVTAFWIVVMVWLLLIDVKVNQRILWSGYSCCGMFTLYVCGVLPLWFRKPNPLILVPIGGVTIILYTGYICLAAGGSWFWGFALPVGAIGLVGVMVVLILVRVLKRGYLFIAGGAVIGIGLYTFIIEILLDAVFSIPYVFWSFYGLGGCTVVGLLLIFLGACRPAREALRRRFFL